MKVLIQRYKSLSVSLKASFWFLLCSLLQKGISVIVTPIFTRLLTAEQYGIVNVYSSWRELFTIIITLRLADGVLGPGLVKEDNDKAGFVSSVHGLLLVLTLCGAIFFGVFRTRLEMLTGLSGFILGVMVVQMWAQATYQLWAKEQRIYFHYKALVILTLVVAVIRPTLGIWVVTHTQDKSIARIIEMASVDFFAYIGLFLLSVIKGKRLFDYRNWKYALSFNIPLIPHFLSQTVLNSADRIMIERMIDSNSSGIYSLAYQISVMTVLFNNAMLQAMSPWTFNKLKKHKEKDITAIGLTALALIGVINLLFIAFAPEIVSLFAPSQYREAIWILPPITMSVFYQFSYLLFADIELYYEKTRTITIATSAGALLNIVLNYIFIRLYGYFAAGYTTLACYAAIAIIHFFAMKKVCRDDLNGYVVYPFKTWALMSCIFIVVGFGFMMSYRSIAIRFGIVSVLLIIGFSQQQKILGLIKMMKKNKYGYRLNSAMYKM